MNPPSRCSTRPTRSTCTPPPPPQADLATLAPKVTHTVRDAVHDADPDLDADVAAWFADDCPLPRLTLLGPVRARTRGTP